MFRIPQKPPKVTDQHEARGPLRSNRWKQIRFSFPSPFLLAVILVFVVLPLVWPESEDPAPTPAARTVFNLAADVTSLTMSDDALHLAATCRDQPLWVWSQEQEATWGRTVLPEHHPGGTRSLCLSPDGMTLAAGNMDGTVSLWKMSASKNPINLRAGSVMVIAVVFSPDGTRLACASSDSQIRIWDLGTLRSRSLPVAHRGPVTALAFSPDGRFLASGGEDQTVRLWDTENPGNNAVLLGHTGVVLAVAFSPSGELAASTAFGDNGVRLWDIEKRKNSAILRGDAFTFTCIAFAGDSQTLLTGDEHGTVTSWDVDSLKRKTSFQAHRGWVKCLAVSSNGKTLVTGGNDGLVEIWDQPSPSEVHAHSH